jgi:hypothetical protein
MLCDQKANGDRLSADNPYFSLIPGEIEFLASGCSIFPWEGFTGAGCFTFQSSTRSLTFLIRETSPLRKATVLTTALTAEFKGLPGVACGPEGDNRPVKKATEARIRIMERMIYITRRIDRLPLRIGG